MTSNREGAVRGRALRRGHYVEKARGAEHFNNKGQYQLIEAWGNTIVLGWDFDASLEKISEYLADLDRRTVALPGR